MPRSAEEQLASRIAMEDLVLSISRRFMTSPDGALDRTIAMTLEECAAFAKAETAQLLQVTEDGQSFALTHRWIKPGLSIGDAPSHTLPIELVAQDLRQKLTLLVPDVNALPDGPLKHSLVSCGIQALASAPVIAGSEIVGSMGLAKLTGPHLFTDEELTLVRFVAETVGAALARRRVHNERQGLERRLHKSERLELVGQLAGGVAHDFNNLLLVIQSCAELCLLDLSRTAKLKDYLLQIGKASGRAAELTRQLLTFSRQGPIKKESLDLNTVLTSLLKMLRRLLPETIAIDHIPGHLLGRILGDAAQLEQVVVNLCVNARDAMPRGGRIQIETQNVLINGEYRKTHAWAKPGRYVLLSVSDSGLGIPPDNLDRIFEPFFTTKEIGHGTGLGLSTVYGVISKHDGMVNVYSEVNRGSVFKIYLPINETSAAQVSREALEPVAGGTETVLLAEDEPQVLEVVRTMLERAGYTVVSAANGAEALARFRERPETFDLLLLDVIMPGLNGVEVAQAARDLRPGCPVLLASGYTAGVLDLAPLDLALPLLAKPYDPDTLLRAIRRALTRSE